LSELIEKKDKLLIVFLRNPLLGKVKRRIAAVLGDKKAYDIYVDLLVHTRAICDTLAIHKAVYYSDYIDNADIWNNNMYEKFLQKGKDIGERMYHVFEDVLKDYKKAVLIGSDIPGITKPILEHAFQELEKSDMVIGPAKDGGYYLIGMKKPIKNVFEKKIWGSSSVLDDTISDLKKIKHTYSLLDQLVDMDTVKDIDEMKLLRNDDR